MPPKLSKSLQNALKKASEKGADKALDSLKKKGDNKLITKRYDDISGEAHAKAFTVAKVSQMDVLDDIFKAIEEFKSNGKSIKEFKDDLIPTLQKKGWWGKHTIKGADGKTKTIQLGSESRINKILRTNISVAQSQARFKQQLKASDSRPYLIYYQQDRPSKRKSHAKLDGKVFRADDPELHRIYPPNGFECNCTMRSLSERQLKNRGLEVENVSDYLNDLKSSGDVTDEDINEMERFDPRGTDFEKDMKKYATEVRDLARQLLKSKPQYSKKELSQAKRSKILKTSIEKTAKDSKATIKHTNLSIEEKSSLNAITKEKMKVLLSSKGGSSGKVLTGFKKVLDTAIEKAQKTPTARGEYVYQSKAVSSSDIQSFRKKYVKGSIVEESDYIIATDKPRGGNVQLRYSSKNVVNIDELSETDENRLLGRNKLFKVTAVEDNEDLLLITLEEVL